jgi:hypothetical protein
MTGREKMRFASLVVALGIVTMLVVILQRPETGSRVDQTFAAVAGSDSGATETSANGGTASFEPPASVPDPAAFGRILDAAGWSADRLAKFGDGEPLNNEQREELLELLRRLRSFDAADLQAWSRNDVSLATIVSDPGQHRGLLVKLKGRANRLKRRTLPDDLATRLEMPTFIECDIGLDGDAGTATLITARVPASWSRMETLDETAEADAVFVKTLPDVDGKPAALFVSRDITWRPTKPALPFVSFGKSILGSLGFDVGALDAVAQRRSIRVSESDAFYGMLVAVKNIGVQQLARLAQSNLEMVRAAWSAEAERLAEAPAADDRKQLALAREVIARAEKGRFSVAPLFNEPAAQVGELVLLDGLARRAVRVDVGTLPDGRPSEAARQFGIDHYYEMDIFTDDSQNNPIVFCATELPAGFPVGESIREQVRVAGFFFKSWSFESRRAATDAADGATGDAKTRQFAPLLIGRGPIWILPEELADSTYSVYVMAGLFAAVLAGVWGAGWWIARGDRRFANRLMSEKYSLPPGESLDNLETRLDADAGESSRPS